MLPYDRDAAVAYAHKWAYARNPAYPNFDAYGGDCTSFVSQCIYAGCGVMNMARDVGWYCRSLNDRAAAWSGVEYLYNFLVANRGAGPFGSEMPLEAALPGDVIQLSFDGLVYKHSLLAVRGYPGIHIAAHTDDSDYRPLETYQYQAARLIRIAGCRR